MSEGTELTTQPGGALMGINPDEYFAQRALVLKARQHVIDKILADSTLFVPGRHFTALPGMFRTEIDPFTGKKTGKRGPAQMLSKEGGEFFPTFFGLTAIPRLIEAVVTAQLTRFVYAGELIDPTGQFSGCAPGTVLCIREASASSVEPQWRYRWQRISEAPKGHYDLIEKGQRRKARQLIQESLPKSLNPNEVYDVVKIDNEYCLAMRLDNENVLADEHDIRSKSQKRAITAVTRAYFGLSNRFKEPSEAGRAEPCEPQQGVAKTQYEKDKPKRNATSANGSERKRGRPPGSKNKPKEAEPTAEDMASVNGPPTEQEQRVIKVGELFDSYNLAHNVGWTLLHNYIRDSITPDNITEAEVGFASELIKKNMPAAKAEPTNGELLKG